MQRDFFFFNSENLWWQAKGSGLRNRDTLEYQGNELQIKVPFLRINFLYLILHKNYLSALTVLKAWGCIYDVIKNELWITCEYWGWHGGVCFIAHRFPKEVSHCLN